MTQFRSVETQPHVGPKIAVIGGGTGNFTVLSGLKPLVGEGLTGIVSMADDGGSTGALRDEQGTLPAGDVRQCLLALSNNPSTFRELMNYRFSDSKRGKKTGLDGQNLGNLIITAAEKLAGEDPHKMMNMLEGFFSITGNVAPVTLDNRRLVLTLPDGMVIEGEHTAEETSLKSLKGSLVSFDKSPTRISEEAEQAIVSADLVVIAPGDLYTSIAPALAVDGMREALERTRAVAQVANLMNRNRHTVGFTVADYVSEAERVIGSPVIDYVLFNTEQPSEESLASYAEEGEFMVEANEDELRSQHYQAVGGLLLSHEKIEVDPSDTLADTRSLIRHDRQAVARAIMSLHYSSGNNFKVVE